MEQEFKPEDALSSAQAMRERVASRATYAPWYAPLYGLACGGLVTSAGLPQPWMALGTTVCLVGVIWLYRYWQDSTGLSVNGYRKGRTRTIAMALAAALMLLMLVGLFLRTRFGIAWAPFACGAVAAVVAGVLSSAWDRAWRAQMKAPVQ